ncbi:MAG: T9SS type A sorting domain-containing protein [Bacteroidales bacterium]|nr:T9SS type A sorting domain-containing protein [Bacteroidales bacterium]
MKKQILFFVLIMIVAIGYAQNMHVTDYLPLTNPRLCQPRVSPDGVLLNAGPVLPGQKILDATVIGNTWYDTQTYNSGNLMNRLYEHADGTIGATWMLRGATGVPDRGTAYNFYNGTTWTGAVPHLGNDPNNGFPSYAPWGPTGEVIAHYQYLTGEGPIKILRREIKGQGDWLESVLDPPDGNYSIVWHSMITSGENHEFIHLLAFVYDDPYQGQEDALLYYRSSDGGVSWEINGEIIEGLGSGFFLAISSLKYSWAQPVGNTIAFTYGFDYFDGLVFKSTDNGDSWEKIVVYESPYTPFNIPDLTPVYGSGDGTSAIALDSQGMAHVVFSRMLWFHDIVSGSGWYYYPTSTEGLIYWNETMPMLDSTIVSSYTLEFLEAGGNLIGWLIGDTASLEIPGDQPSYGVGLTSMPQIGIDAEDNLFVAYSALAPDYFSGQYYFRHIFCNASFDGGTTWNGIKDMTEGIVFLYSECVFPAVSPVVDDKVHIIFQEDFTPGTGSGEEAYINHMNFPKAYFVGIPGVTEPSGFVVSQNYPNPATQSTQFEIRMEKTATVSVSILNIVGKTLKRMELGRMNSGTQVISLDLSGLTKGMYTYCVEVDGERITRKMMVQ